MASSGMQEPIGTALSRLTPRLRDRLRHVHFFVGADPFFAGLNRGQESYTFADGRTISYKELAHCSYPHHQTHLASVDRRTTIVLPTLRLYTDHVATVAHELGHALHEVVGFDWVAQPITEYARENSREAFAEAFEAWVMDQPIRPEIDDRTLALLEVLS